MGTKRQHAESARQGQVDSSSSGESPVASLDQCKRVVEIAISKNVSESPLIATVNSHFPEPRADEKLLHPTAFARHDEGSLPSAEMPPKKKAKTLEEAMRQLNAAFAETVRRKVREDPSSDLSATAQQYAEDVRSLLAQFNGPGSENEEDGEQLEVVPTPPSSVEFVSLSDLPDAGERDGENEVYFGASLDLDTFASTKRQSHLFRRGSSLLDSPKGFESSVGGFLTSQTIGSGSSVWNDPVLTSLRIPAQALQVDALIQRNENTEIWCGSHSATRVAVKRLVKEKQTVENIIAFATDIKDLACLRHPNIVHLVGVAWEHAVDFQTVTEFMDKGDLRSLLDTSVASSFTWTDGKCQVAIQIAESLAYLHTQTQCAPRIIITSRKVLVDSNATAKLNILHSPFTAKSITNIRWTAPEILSGGPHTTSADIFTFGVLLAELDTTKAPYSEVAGAGEELTLGQRITCGGIQPTFSPDCPDGIVTLARQCLFPDPTLRPDAERVTYILREILKNEL